MDSVKVERLAELTARQAETEALIKDLMADFELSIKAKLEQKKVTAEEINEIKAQISSEALDDFERTGEKKMLGGIGIRISSGIQYDEKKAFEFAKEKDMFLTLDKKAFDKAADGLGLDFVQSVEKKTVTFPKVIKL